MTDTAETDEHEIPWNSLVMGWFPTVSQPGYGGSGLPLVNLMCPGCTTGHGGEALMGRVSLAEGGGLVLTVWHPTGYVGGHPEARRKAGGKRPPRWVMVATLLLDLENLVGPYPLCCTRHGASQVPNAALITALQKAIRRQTKTLGASPVRLVASSLVA